MSDIDPKLIDKLVELAQNAQDTAEAAIDYVDYEKATSGNWNRLETLLSLQIKLVTEFGAAVQALYPEADLPAEVREVDFRGTQVELSYQDDRANDRSTRVVGFTPNRGDLR